MTPTMIAVFIVLAIIGMCLAAAIEQAGSAIVIIVIALVLCKVIF